MPDKPLTVITYAASASLAAAALIYFFNPNYLIDGDPSTSSASTRKKSVVGLFNPANDCFINSVLQSLAGLGELRLYLIRELHRRKLDSSDIYKSIPLQSENYKPVNVSKLLSLQSGEVTQGLKDIIDGLNERPIYKKTISAAGFIAVLEHAFGTRISKAQQDAQELLQIVAERLCDEYHAGKEARKRARSATGTASLDIPVTTNGLGLSVNHDRSSIRYPSIHASCMVDSDDVEDEEVEDDDDFTEESGFPLEGRTQSQIECQQCRFVPKSAPISFVMLTLSVPQKSSATLNECFDDHFKREFIDDYKCDKCRLEHAITVFEKELESTRSDRSKELIKQKIDKVQKAIDNDPEKPPEDVKLPESKSAPTQRISRHVQITDFPKVLVIHLSRSIFDPRMSSAKNTAKVSFPERLPLGGLLNRRNYKLLGVVTHKGTHNSGHYESFRRQHIYAPYSTPHVGPDVGPYSTSQTPNGSPPPNPTSASHATARLNSLDATTMTSVLTDSPSSATTSTPSFISGRPSSASTRPSSASLNGPRDLFATAVSPAEALSKPEDSQSRRGSSATQRALSVVDGTRLRRKKKVSDRWWRISDDKIKECKTSDVLGMQKEVYMLFYEMERD